MRNIANLLVVAAAASILAMPFARAAEPSDASTSSRNHVQQHQDAVPQPPAQKPGARDQSAPDQSAEAPQSPAVITPPSTGDKSVITPPATGAAKMPVIRPPGTPGNKDDIQPK